MVPRPTKPIVSMRTPPSYIRINAISEGPSCALPWHRRLAIKNKKFAHGIINHQRRNQVGTEGISCQHSKTPDKSSHHRCADDDGDARNQIEKRDFHEPVITPRNEYPVNVE